MTLETVHDVPVAKGTPEIDFSFTPTAGAFSYSVGNTVYTPANIYWVCADTVITFTASTIFDDEDEWALSYEWDFGDDSYGFGLTVTHQFKSNNAHNQIVLTVVDNLGRRWRARKQIYLRSYQDIVLAMAPDEYWPLTEIRGTVADNKASVGNNGTYTDGFTLGVGGPLSGSDVAVGLDGTDGYIDIPDVTPFANSATRTFVLWAYRDTQTSFDALISSSTGEPLIYFDENSTNIVMRTDYGGTPTYATLGSASTGAWHHLAIIVDQTANEAILYVDGVAGTAETIEAYAVTNGTLQIGSEHFFDGRVCHVAIWEQALAEADIQTLYNAVA